VFALDSLLTISQKSSPNRVIGSLLEVKGW